MQQDHLTAERNKRYRLKTMGKPCCSCGGPREPGRVNMYCRDCKRANHLKNAYGLTQKEYGQMITEQEGRCAICKKETDSWLRVDHNHTTGKVRGLLCDGCNRAVASVETLDALIHEYLEKYDATA